MPNTNFQTFHQMGQAINEVVRQATGRDRVQKIDMDHVTVAQSNYYEEVTVSGSMVSFTDRVGNTPLEKCVVQIEPVQEGTGDPSPDNVRSISGWTGAKVTRTGKNLLNESVKTQNATYVFFNSTGDKSEKTMTLPAGTYTISVSYTGTVKAHINVYRINPYERIAIAYSTTSLTFTLTKTEDILLWMQNSDFSIQDIGTIQLELGSTATDYEPYQSNTYDITFPSEAGTVYGGTLDVTTGELVVDRVMADMGNYTYSLWNSTSARDVFSVTFNDIKSNTSPNEPINGISSVFVPTSYNKTWNHWQFSYTNTDKQVAFIVPHNMFADATAFKEYVTGVQLVYELATHITYQLTPQEVRTLLGQNAIWADTGDIEVKYKVLKEMY